MKADITFAKRGEMVYISHLDLMRLMQRACRRARLPTIVSKGFHPHLKLALKRALKLGVESVNEEASIYLSEHVDPELLATKLNESLPEGVRILNAKIV